MWSKKLAEVCSYVCGAATLYVCERSMVGAHKGPRGHGMICRRMDEGRRTLGPAKGDPADCCCSEQLLRSA